MTYGSFINTISDPMRDATPEVGLGGTILMWSDRIPVTILVVDRGGKLLGVSEDNATRTDSNGMSEVQTYEFTPGDGPVRWFTLRKDGRYVEAGQPMKGGTVLKVGHREKYHDFSF